MLLGLAAHGAISKAIVLTPHVDAIRAEFSRGFTAWHQAQFGEPAEIEWRNVGGTADALRFIQSEFTRKPDGIGLDILFGGGLEPYLLLADKKLSAPHELPPEITRGLEPIAAGMEIHDPKHQWYGSALSSFGILQNLRVQQRMGLPLVARWEQLADPQLFGWVGAGDPRNSGTMGVMFEAFLQAYGWERGWQMLTEIGGNTRGFDRLSTTTAKDVTLGETAYAFAIDFYGFGQVAFAGRTNLIYTLPKDFAAVSPDGIALLRGGPNPITAGRFIDYVLSEAGQKLWFLPKGHPEGAQQFSIDRMSVRPDFYRRYRDISNIESSPFDLPQPFRYNAKLARERREIVAALVGTLLVDTHPELKAAWQAIRNRHSVEADRVAFGRMPITETDALQLASGTWKNPAERNRIKIEWQRFAQEKYRVLTRAKP